MATRFGGARPTQISATKRNWFVALLSAVIVVLIVAIVLILQPPDLSASKDNDSSPVVSPTATAPSTQVLVANQRIEVGTPLNPGLFRDEPTSIDRIPVDAILASDKATLIGMYAKRLIIPNIPLVREDITNIQLTGVTEMIPPGYRAVTIQVNQISSVEGFTRPNTRVDVLWTFTDTDRSRKVATIVRFAKILSFGGVTATAGAQTSGNKVDTVTLLVSEKDAQRIELARSTGSLSLVLVGDREEIKVDDTPSMTTIDTIVGRGSRVETISKDPVDGRMISTDPITGKKTTYCLRGRRWVPDCDED
jgi:pilus assembly protein CpaB